MYYDILSRGKIKPEDLEPNIAGFEYYLESFKELNSTRLMGMSVGPIPFTAILEYFKVYPCDDFEEFNYIIRRMDDAFLNQQSGKQRTEGKNSVQANKNS
jgi:hypothetical protein